MIKKQLHEWKVLLLFGALSLLFVYFRVKPIYYQIVPYTYDQGRDFLKAEEIVRFRNPTFIGPTTGIQGVNHGVWWYYFLSVPYALSSGNPAGFYWGVLVLSLMSTILFTKFLKREFGNEIAVLFLLIVTVSPYFIGISIFAANNILAPPFVLLFIFSAYKFFKTSEKKYLFLTGLSLSFIFESEMPFGLCIIPSFFIASLLFVPLRSMYRKPGHLAYLIVGLLLPFVPRLLFEVKHNFIQTKSILHFLTSPSMHHPQPFLDIAHDRALLFLSYFQEIFYNSNPHLVFAAVLIVLSLLICGHKQFSMVHRKVLYFFSGMIGLIFLFSLLYRNNFFWDYYLEGIHYLFVFCILLLVYVSRHLDPRKKLITGILIFFSLLTLYHLGQEIIKRDSTLVIGLRQDSQTIETVYSLVGKHDFCARIYTPPVVPYTYNYLFHYYSLQGYKVPLENPVNDMCLYIIDPDTYGFRIEAWRKNNIPRNFSKEKEITMPNKAKIEVWIKQ